MNLDVSVIIPTYNRADLIGDTLRSILSQSYRPAEVIVVDDGSTDQTDVVVRRFEPAVRYMKIENSGECRARNAGVAASSAPWIAFCDSDDLWHPDKLRLQMALLRDAPDVEYTFTNFRIVENGRWSATTKFDTAPPDYWSLPQLEIDGQRSVVTVPMFGSLLRYQPIFPSTLLMKRSFFDAAGPWNEPLGRTRSVDLEFHLRCVMRAPIGVVRTAVTGIRKHASNFSGDTLKNSLGEIEILKYVLAHHPGAKRYVAEIQGQIATRTIAAAEKAFETGDLKTAAELFDSVPGYPRSFKLRAKNLIANTPAPARQILRRACSMLAAANRAGRSPTNVSS